MAISGNKTLRTKCAACGKEIPSEVDPDPSGRQTWALLGEDSGKAKVFPACRDCYEKGWRPPGFKG
ncbi:MAG: hypothetical protein D6760_05420 [Deltaproteobacteria bacterium]|nr:MAG: hypothetical protein D6760_05420 [Deltaproteobacteria bacterium]